MIQVKRIYEQAAAEDGRRFLVERLWPRGVKKEALEAAGWIKEAAPSDGLRRWFGHDPAKWEEFRARYRSELEARRWSWERLLEEAGQGTVTLLYSARDREHNNAVALKEFLEGQLEKERARSCGTGSP